MSSPECPPPDIASPNTFQHTWVPWSCSWSLPSLILQNFVFVQVDPIPNRKEGNKTEDRTPNAQTETAPGSLLPQHCVHLSTVTVTTTPCCLQVICGFAWHTGWWVPPRWRPGLTSLSVSQPLAPCQVHSRDLVTALNGWMKKASTVSDCVEQTGY